MSASGIHGGRVKEPRIVRRTVLPVESKRASTLSDLSQAWSTFGEAKNVLQRLESRAVSPPVKDKRLGELKNHKKVKPHGAHFDAKARDITGRSMGEPHARRMTGRDTQELSAVKTSPEVLFSDDNEKENVVEGAILNEHGAGEGRNQDVQDRSETVRLGQAAPHGDMQHRSQTSTVRHATVSAAECPICSPPRPTHSASHNPTTSPSIPASSCPICSPPPPPYSASSNPNVVRFSRSPTHLSHSNPRAVFGPPVNFGSQQTSTATVSSRQPPRVVQERPLLHTRTTHSTHGGAAQRNMTHLRPVTEPVPGIGSGQASLRKFELPTDTLSALREKIEQQKKAVQATAAQVDALTQKQPDTNTSKFYPLPEASVTSNSSTSYTSPPRSHLLHPVPPSSPPPQYSHPVKRRKVVSVPAPQSYRGFTAESGGSSGAKRPLQWRSNLERVGSLAAEATSTVQPSSRARKVQRVATSETVRPTHQPVATRKVASGSGQSIGATITTSSWRVGKKLTDRILKQQPGLTKSDPVVAESRSLPTLTRDTSTTPPAAGFNNEGGTSPLASPPSSSGESLVRGSALPTTAAKLLEDLEMLSQDEERAEDKLSRPKRYNPRSLDSAAKKPRFNFEPVYPTQKVRHYDQAKVQRYMQRKQEERMQKLREEQLAQDQVRQERQQRLKELYQQQKKTLATNLRSRQRQREAYSKALSSAPVHVHIHDSSRSESEAGSDEITRPLLTITPPRDTTHRPSGPRPYPPPTRTPPRGAHATSPPRHTATLSPGNTAQYTQPPNTSPISVRSNQQGNQSPYSPASARLRSQSHSPVSPRTYSIPRSSPTSPGREGTTSQYPSVYTHSTAQAERSHGTQPPSGELPTFSPSPRREGTTSQHPSVYTHPTAQAERSHGTQPSSGELTSLLRGSSSAPQATRTAAESIGHRSREERIQQLTITALNLKERIAAETRKLTEGSAKSLSRESSPSARSLTISPPRPQRYRHRFSKEPQLQPTDLPGVHNLHQHALQAELARREGEAALKIQAAYRGHKVRQSLQWRLPSGRTMVPGLRGVPVGGGGDSDSESDVEDGGPEVPETQLMAENGPLLEQAREEPVQVSQSCPVLPGATPPVHAPWEQAGGDAHSVINVFIERQKRLQATLAELKNRKLEELKRIRSSTSVSRTDRRSPGTSPFGAGGTSPLPSTGAPAASLEGTQPLSYSYSQTFETTPSKDEDDGSLVSDLFSVDSLVATTDTHAGVTSVLVSTSEPQAYIAAADLSDRPTAASTLPAAESCSRHSPSESMREVSAITPPGSPSFVESFSNQRPGQPGRKQPTMPPGEPKTGRLSPRSLELRLQAELRLLETVEESMRHLSNMESTRVVSLAQQETVTLAQLLKSRQQKHESEVESLAAQAKQEVEDAQRQFEKVHQEAAQASERIKRLQEEADAQAREHMRKLTQMQEASSQESRDASKQLAEVRCTATTAVIEAAQQQMEAAHKMAVSAASAAAQQAVKAAMGSWVVPDASKPTEVHISQSRKPRGEESAVQHSTDGVYTELGIDTTYTSDFDSSAAQPKTQEGASTASASDAETNHSHSTHDSSIHESLTPVPSHEQVDVGSAHVDGGGSDADRTLVEEEEEEEGEVDESLQATTPEEQSEEDIDEVSFRELLPSEGHRRQRSRWLHSSESEFHVSSPAPSQGEHSRSRTPTGGELSPFNTEDSFFQFTSRMVRQYMREEELRAKHQATLLQLREQALQERTQAELEWLELKKQQLRSKGADELTPSLLKRERGLRKKLQQEQAEIRRLKEAQKTASHERKLMLLQQQEISKMKKSAKYYREKIRSHRERGASPMSTPTGDREFSPSPSLEDSGQALEETMSIVSEPSVTEELSEEPPHTPTTPQQHSTPAHTPTHSLTFPTYTQEATPTAQPQPVSEQEGSTHTETTPTVKTGNQRLRTADTEGPSQLQTPGSSSATFKKLKKLTSADAEKYLTQRERWLLKRRHMAEEALRQQQELLEREQRLEREEEEVGRLVDQALQCYQSRRGERKPVGKTPRASAKERIPRETSDSHPEEKSGSHPGEGSDSHHSVAQSHASLGRRPTTSATSASITEDLSEEVAPGSGRARGESAEGYSTDTFESLEATPTPPPSTSTPAQPKPHAIGDLSLTGSLKTSDHSISDSAVTTSSERSALEARIRQLREQLHQRKEEVRRVQSEQRRKKKALLHQQEENLKRKLEVVENVLTRTRKAPATPPPVDSAPSSEGWPSSPEPTPPPTLREEDTMTQEEGFQAESEPAGMATDRTTDTRTTGGRAPEETAPNQISTWPFEHSLTKPAAVSKLQETQSTASTPVPQNIHTPAAELGERVPTVTSGDISAESIPEELEYNSRSVPGVITPQKPLQTAEPLIRPMREPPTAELASLASSIAEEGSYSAAAPPKPEEEWPQEPSYTETFEAAVTLTEPEEAETGKEVQETDKTGEDTQFEILPSSVHDESPPLSVHDKSPPSSIHDESPPLSVRDESPPPSIHDESPPPAYDESPPPSIHDESPPPSPHDVEERPVFQLGQRVLIGSVMAGTVRYTGSTHFAEGFWIGVELDLPKGINDGSKDGQRYFSCEPDHGLFAPPSKVSLLDEEEEEEEEVESEGSVEEEIESSLDKSDDQFWQEGAAIAGGDEPGEPRDSYTPDFEPSDKEESTAEQAPPSDKEATPEPAPVQDVEGNVQEQSLLSDEAAEDHPITEATELQLPALGGDIAHGSSVIPQVALEEEAPSGQSPVLPIMPAFAPPPGFEGEASRESSEERELISPQREKTETIVGELTQDLSNEAFETVHRIWRNKQRSTAEVVVYKDKEIPLTLEEKADKITDELLALLIQSETNLVCNIHSTKASHSPEHMNTKTNRELPARLIIPAFNVESSPPPISPPSTFRGSPPPAEYSPPGSPPRHLSQASAARVAAGDKSPFLAIQQEPGSPPHSRKASVSPRFLEHSNSLETITELTESVRFKTPQSTVPSERKHVDRVVEEAWNVANNVGLDSLHSTTFKCPQGVLSLFRDTRESKCNQAEDKCRAAYLQLVYTLSIETLRELYPPSTPCQVWARQCATGRTLVRRRSRDEATALEQVQKKVFATLMKGKLPPQLPAVKFLHGMKRPGGREIDFVDSTLIKELREEEPGWVDYTEDEVQVKIRTADAILDSLLTETIQVLMNIEQKRQRRA